MTRQQKILLGFASFWPLILLMIAAALIFAAVFSQFFQVFPLIATQPSTFSPSPTVIILGVALFLLAIALQMFATVLSWALVILFIVLAIGNNRLDNNLKVFWVIMLVFGSWVAQFIYWYLNIWREPDGAT